MIRRGALPATALAAFLLAGCATAPPPRIEPGWTSGRLSVRVDATDTDPAHGVSAGFELRGDGERGELRLNSPLGMRVATARWAPGLALLQTADGERRFDSLDALSRQALGEALPLAAFGDWIAGRPWSGAPSRTIDGGFAQLGWDVSLARLAARAIELRREAPPAVRVRVQLDDPG